MTAFVKMHGLGNDFAIFDARTDPFAPGPAAIARLADRRRGIGFDQLVLIAPSEMADAALRFFNADGSESGACGNGTRCAARLLGERTGRRRLRLETKAGLLSCELHEDGTVSVAMPEPRWSWEEVPLAEPRDTLFLEGLARDLPPGTALSVGNPHLVFFLDSSDALDSPELERLGAALERHPLFPERTNVGFAVKTEPDVLRLRVFERGVGFTEACGSGACAAVVAARRRGLVGTRVRVVLDGGELEIRWPGSGPVTMRGPATYVYEGRLHPDLLGA